MKAHFVKYIFRVTTEDVYHCSYCGGGGVVKSLDLNSTDIYSQNAGKW